jgi:hypothetical protein
MMHLSKFLSSAACRPPGLHRSSEVTSIPLLWVAEPTFLRLASPKICEDPCLPRTPVFGRINPRGSGRAAGAETKEDV